MGIALGGTALRGARWGDRVITQARLGNQLLWSASSQRDDFERAQLGDLWVPVGGTSGTYQATIVNGSLRLNIPDGLISESLRTARHRFIGATAQNENGVLKIRVGSRGDDDGGLYTQVFDWMPNDDTGSSGVGIELRASNLYIVRRVANNDQQMAHCGSYLPGEDIWLASNGRNYSMYRQGKFVGAWPDEGGTAVRGPDNRSMGVVVRGFKGFFGPRRFSAAIDYIEHN